MVGWAEGYRTLGVEAQLTFLGLFVSQSIRQSSCGLFAVRHPSVLCELQKAPQYVILSKISRAEAAGGSSHMQLSPL